MSPRMQRALTWSVLTSSSLVMLGVFVQVYLIAVYIVGGDGDVLDAHKGIGGIVHILEVLAFLTGLGAYWKKWGEVGLVFALAAVGTLQMGLISASGDWVRGLHGLLALVVLILAHAVVQHAVRALGLGRHGSTGTP